MFQRIYLENVTVEQAVKDAQAALEKKVKEFKALFGK